MTTFLVGYSIVSTLVAVISTCNCIAATLAMREVTRQMNETARGR